MKNRSTKQGHKEGHSESVKQKTTNESSVEKERQMMKESLLLPQTAGGKTTSASMCERSNEWAQQRLGERKTELDQKLYKSIVKLNSDRLEIVSELANLRKSSSTGNLSKAAHGAGNDTPHDKSATKTGLRARSSHNSPIITSKHSHKTSQELSRLTQRRSSAITSSDIMKMSGNAARIAISVGHDSSSDDSDSSDTTGDARPGHRAGACDHSGHQGSLSLTSSLGYRGCLEDRSQSQMVENVTRRYAKQLSAKTRPDK